MEDAKVSLEGKIIVFKSLAIVKIVYFSHLKSVPNKTVEELMELHSS